MAEVTNDKQIVANNAQSFIGTSTQTPFSSSCIGINKLGLVSFSETSPQTVEKAVIPQEGKEKSESNLKIAIYNESQGTHRKRLGISCFFRSYTLPYPRTATNVRTK
ncbi:MAG: hypothetical protein IJY39_12790, partial [Clostridia bacterium]|nr:hypothetical protein [Clostridia bacterium]